MTLLDDASDWACAAANWLYDLPDGVEVSSRHVREAIGDPPEGHEALMNTLINQARREDFLLSTNRIDWATHEKAKGRRIAVWLVNKP